MKQAFTTSYSEPNIGDPTKHRNLRFRLKNRRHKKHQKNTKKDDINVENDQKKEIKDIKEENDNYDGRDEIVDKIEDENRCKNVNKYLIFIILIVLHK